MRTTVETGVLMMEDTSCNKHLISEGFNSIGCSLKVTKENVVLVMTLCNR